jgi:hypothetical protein
MSSVGTNMKRKARLNRLGSPDRGPAAHALQDQREEGDADVDGDRRDRGTGDTQERDQKEAGEKTP